MSFTSFGPGPLRSREQVMEAIIQVAEELDMPDKKGACLIAGMTVAQEAGADRGGDNIPEFWCPANPTNDPETLQYDHDSTSDDSRSSGYFQQQPPWWGTAAQRMDVRESAHMFLTSLKRYPYRAGNAQEANNWAQKVQGSSYPNAYAKWWQLANDVYNNVINANESEETPMPRWKGDPIWLPDVLRAEGLTVREIAGWRDRGHGDFGEIWGVVCHHTGSNNASAESIAFHPTLGLCSQLHLSRAGVYTVCGAGTAWHAGNGAWPGLPTNGANSRTIGIEAANDGGGSPGKPHRSSWPDVQYDAYVRGVAAILRRLEQG